MKTYKKLIILFIVCALGIFNFACGQTKQKPAMLRFHVRANSNSAEDQAVKLKVRDAVLDWLEPELEAVTDIQTAKNEISRREKHIKAIADRILLEQGFSYKAKVRVDNEHFPTRMYGETVIESGYYDALIIELGSGTGDNWWCVLYPPLCYVEAEGNGDFRYKSKIKELIDKYFN